MIPDRSVRPRGPPPEHSRTPGALHPEGGLAGKIIVCVITGSGLKDPERAMEEFAPDLPAIPAELSAVEQEMGLG